MDMVQGIRRQGFRKWYEGQLMRSHGCLVLLLLSLLGLLGSLEAHDAAQSLADQMALVLCVLASAGIGLWALRRYLRLLHHAEYLADQAVCRGCNAYARWEVEGQPPPAGAALQVRCRCCGHRWQIDL